MSQSPTYKLGIAFDIDGLADFMYGFAAYRLLFRAILRADRGLLHGCRLWDGDTNATLAGAARDYVIAVESGFPERLGEIARLMADVDHPGLKTPAHRLLRPEALAGEPLVLAARINELGHLDQCDTSWVLTAWDTESRDAQTPGGMAPGGEDSAQRKPG
jgi:hypothetical protein